MLRPTRIRVNEMKKLYSVLGSVIVMCMMLMLTGCLPHKPTIVTGLNFEDTNCSADGEKKLIAQGSGIVNVTVTTTFTITINGQSTVVTTTKKTNELPVMAGNEIEIVFTPSCQEETEAFFTLPDGKTQKVTASSPLFKWTVPDNFKSGMEIKGESIYEIDEAKYKASGKIILTSIEI